VSRNAPPRADTSPPDYHAGLRSSTEESDLDDLPVEGTIPEWLSGTLVRNGPGLWDAGRRSYRHWFDGQAMLHRFGFHNGQVSYRGRFLDSANYRAVRQQGKIAYGEFATDPCVSIFSRLFSRFAPPPEAPAVNANVNVLLAEGRSLAITEAPLAIEFDPRTLETLGVVGFDDNLQAHVTTAHPHIEPRTGHLINYGLAFSKRSEYRLFRQPDGTGRREVIGTYPVDLPGYVHSYAITERYGVLAVFPFVVNPLSFLLRRRPFIENYRWRPELGTRIAVIDLANGDVREFQAPPVFSFHHINAYDDGDTIVMDLCGYDDAGVVQAFYLHRLRAGTEVPIAVPTRFRIDLASGRVDVRRLAEVSFELPRINYGAHNGRPYRYAYGVGTTDGRDFFNQLVKLDTGGPDGERAETTIWRGTRCYPGEPVFVPRPGAEREDDGVVLSVVLDASAHRSFLLVLDGASFTELARASVPHPIPFGFHGQFARSR
jgi:Lignostilbene-alpha,beta-dioxygenase and related enzymes